MNCKEGDLAVQIAAKDLKQNIGNMYEVIERAPPKNDGEACWFVRALQPHVTIKNDVIYNRPAGHVSRCRDSSLRPIRPPAPPKAAPAPSRELEHS